MSKVVWSAAIALAAFMATPTFAADPKGAQAEYNKSVKQAKADFDKAIAQCKSGQEDKRSQCYKDARKKRNEAREAASDAYTNATGKPEPSPGS